MFTRKTVSIFALSIAALSLTACGHDDAPAADSSPSSATASASSAPTSTPQTYSPSSGESNASADTDTHDLSGGAHGGAQAPSDPAAPEATLDHLTEADKKGARDAAKEVVALYGSGASAKEWTKALNPHITAGLQSDFAGTDPAPLKMRVTGDARLVDDPTIPADNAYWARALVPTDHGDYAVKLQRSASRPDAWKAAEIVPASVYGKEAENGE